MSQDGSESSNQKMNVERFPAEVVRALARPYDFDIHGASLVSIWFRTSPEIELKLLARDGAGGIYGQLRDRGDIVFVSSEGAGGIIAPDLETAILLFVCHPYWRDLLKFSGDGKLSEMRRTLPFAERDYFERTPNARELGAMIRENLGLPSVTDVLDVLYTSVAATPQRLTLLAPDGSKLGSLFNRFTVDRNPAWRKQLAVFSPPFVAK